jgi:acyl carrier protein
VFDVPLGQLNAESSPQTIESWDSVQHLNLALVLEQQFGMRFEPEDFERMQTIGAIVDVIQSKQS